MVRTCLGPFTRALVVEHPDRALDPLLVADDVEVDRRADVPDEDALIAWINEGGHSLLFKRSRVPVTRRVVESCPSLMAVQLCCIGDDSVDKQACADHGVLVFNDPVSNGRSVVELAIGHIVALARRLYETYDHTRAGGFDKSQDERFEIAGRTLGVLGLGNIGRAVARAAEAMGMRVIFHDTREVAREVGNEMGWEEASTIDALFRRSDVVTVHVSAEDAKGRRNERLLTRAHFAQLAADRPGESPRLFLNLARGFLYDPADLLDAIDKGEVRRAAVDVYPEEPRGKGPWNNPYAGQARVAGTPHLGAATLDAQPRIARRVAHTVKAFHRSGALRDCVYRPRLVLGLGDLEHARVVLAIAHSTARGTRKAIQDAIFEAGASADATAHQDFDELGMAYDLTALDRPLTAEQLQRMVEAAQRLTGDVAAIRSIRQVAL